MTETDKITNIVVEVVHEVGRATELHGEMGTFHHGYAVILEEMDELWEQVKKSGYNVAEIRREAIQVAAMAIRFVHDLCPKED